jgi:hypothetical protein
MTQPFVAVLIKKRAKDKRLKFCNAVLLLGQGKLDKGHGTAKSNVYMICICISFYDSCKTVLVTAVCCLRSNGCQSSVGHFFYIKM